MSTVTSSENPDIGTPRDALWCESCEHEVSPDDAVTLYECSSCGEVTTERRCESCNLFKARSEEQGCPDCEEQLTEAQVTTDHDGETILFADFVADAPAYADRISFQREQEAAERAEKEAVEDAKRQEHSHRIAWKTAQVGDVIIKPNPASWESPYRVLAYKHTTPDGRIIAGLYDHSMRTEVFEPSDMLDRSTDPEVIARENHEAAAEPLATLTRLPDGQIAIASSLTRGVAVELGHAPKEGALLPVIELGTAGSNIYNRIGVFHDPELAVAFLDTLEQAALDYARLIGATADYSTDRVQVDLDAGWVSSDFFVSGTVQLGTSSWTRDEGPILNLVYDNNVVTFTDPNLVLGAIAVARQHLCHLTLTPKVIG